MVTHLYRTMKMRNLGGTNDLYNAQEVILLREIGENRFRFIHTSLIRESVIS